MVTRRRLIQMGMSGAGSLTLLYAGFNYARKESEFSTSDNDVASPYTTPFIDKLPLPSRPINVNALNTSAAEGAKCYEIIEEQALVKMHSELAATVVWRYRDVNTPDDSSLVVGPTFKVRMGQEREPICVRFRNNLPSDQDHQGFGLPHTTVHLHGGHVEARSDGFPENHDNLEFTPVFESGKYFDYRYDMEDPGHTTGEPDRFDRPSTLWYHDHFFDFTGPNVYRGLSGFYLVFDELDTGDESDTSGLQLPSDEFDIPLVFQDRQFAEDGSMLYNSFNHNGFLGDKFLVNGMIQPYLRVQRRKYRFRLLNGSNARFYQFFLTDDAGDHYSFDQIAVGGGLLAEPIRDRESLLIGMAERKELVIDFSQFDSGTELYFENRLMQEDGRGPKGDFVNPEILEHGTKVLKFIVEGGEVDDPSRVHDVLRPFDPISQEELDSAEVSKFVFDRKQGAWTINGKLADLSKPMESPVLNKPVLWHLVNKSGGWWHPIHIHLEFMRVIRRNGKLPALDERDGMARKDTVLLGPNDEVEVFLKFRDYPGPWVFHCHNLEHEDMRMMARFDVEDEESD